MKKISLLLFGLFLFIGCAKPTSFQKMSGKEAQEAMAQLEDYVIVDVRRKDEYESGHIPNAILVPNEAIQEGNYAGLEDKEKTYFLYCRSGNRSNQAATKLTNEGYTNIIDMGGIGDWPGDIVGGN